MSWIDYYKNTFCVTYNEISKNFNANIEEKVLCQKFIKLVDQSCELLKRFLNYNGLFQFENREVIKEAFSVELIEDGELWIDALQLFEAYKSEQEKFNSLIALFCKNGSFIIFKKLMKKFEKLTDNYEKNSQMVL